MKSSASHLDKARALATFQKPSKEFLRLNPIPTGEEKRAAPVNSRNENHTHGQLSNAKPKRHKAPALGRAVQGKTESDGRIVVRFVGYRVRPLDPDNFAGSVKDLLDGCRHAGLIPGDEPWRIILETEQVCVRSYAQEKTVIEIENPTR